MARVADDQFGVGLTFGHCSDGRICVLRMPENGPACLCGEIEEHDVLLSANEVLCGGKTMDQLRELIVGPWNTTVALSLQRHTDGTEYRVALQRTFTSAARVAEGPVHVEYYRAGRKGLVRRKPVVQGRWMVLRDGWLWLYAEDPERKNSPKVHHVHDLSLCTITFPFTDPVPPGINHCFGLCNSQEPSGKTRVIGFASAAEATRWSTSVRHWVNLTTPLRTGQMPPVSPARSPGPASAITKRYQKPRSPFPLTLDSDRDSDKNSDRGSDRGSEQSTKDSERSKGSERSTARLDPGPIAPLRDCSLGDSVLCLVEGWQDDDGESDDLDALDCGDDVGGTTLLGGPGVVLGQTRRPRGAGGAGLTLSTRPRAGLDQVGTLFL
mmetsp:Transcript_29434/g.68240  ORF Transcript_29434/g.68240 Transcript_29434/m.68240 type:complete len:381 (+) Transcript_29434:44-1186(+)